MLGAEREEADLPDDDTVAVLAGLRASWPRRRRPCPRRRRHRRRPRPRRSLRRSQAPPKEKESAAKPADKADKKEDDKPKPVWSADTWSGLALRGIGPAVTSGRIADVAVDPTDKKRWFLAVASGGVWKTENAGTTWTPVFDGEASYSIACVAIDPRNPNVVWVGTGENNSQRSVGYGDGVYKSEDGGKSWKNVGLKSSEHIGKILIHPKDPNTVYVAAQGPLWAPGGERGLYKTTDGGKTWTAVLTISENTGVSDVVMDPRDPDVLIASAWQRRRHVFTLINGGPESGLHKTTDGGKTWRKITSGLPKEEMGRIGLAIAPTDPDTVYALVETAAAAKASGTYRSTNRGETWEKRSEYAPQAMYYQKVYVDPKNAERIYSMDVFLKVSDDAGKTWRNLGERYKHVDNHVIWIDPDDTDHYLVGCDGGLYESWDRAATWHFFGNLPVTQFYRVDVDNSSPVYYVYGGTQDNNSLGGPSRTLTEHGALNSDWFVTWGGDGFHSRVDPVDPNIVYSTLQHGVLARYDRKSGEQVLIQPHEAPGDAPLRWNWDSPLVLSPHQHTRLYFAAQRVFRSEDRGDSWTPISARPHPPARPQHAQGDGQGVGPRRRGQEPVDVALRQHRLARRVAARPGPALRRHRRRPRPGDRGRRPDLAPPGQLPGRARAQLRQRPLRLALRQGPRLRHLQQPQERRLQALRAEERRPRPQLDVRQLRPAGKRGRLDHRRGHGAEGAALRRHRVRPLLLEGRRGEVDPPQGRPAHDPGARPRDPEARGRPRDRDASAAASSCSTT